ncbi:aminotransferase class V-fold PLP-dependent enzyme [Verrucomicrobia bacterium]|nr:aminotransferase class V-fold PLP-dependent enzyme [Verrucomicrobiota bacterium]
MNLAEIIGNEEKRLARFPIAREKIFLSHAAVTALPHCAAQAMADYAYSSCKDHQEFPEFMKTMAETRQLSANLIGAEASEVALLGPTSLGLSLFAKGISWEPEDEVICYMDDYPANVYSWMELERIGVKVKYLKPDELGVITPELIESNLSGKTRLVALASCNYLSGYRIDIDSIGKMLGQKNILFALDGIQTCGAFPTSVEHVDFMSADAHKWLLGPMAMGIVYVKQKNFDLLRPALLGAWNVRSPDYITQEEISFHNSARRYEPGVLNASGIVGLKAVLEMIQKIGIDSISERLLEIKSILVKGLESLGYKIHGPKNGKNASSITTFSHQSEKSSQIFENLNNAGIIASCRKNRQGEELLRFSPHFYNTEREINQSLDILAQLSR